MSIDGQNITQITKSGLTYINEQGSASFIDFSKCYADYLARFMEKERLQRFKQMNHMNRITLAIWLRRHRTWKEVARRDITGWSDEDKLPFIEFYTVPPTRFTFATQDDFRRVKYEIEGFGWRTFDLS